MTRHGCAWSRATGALTAAVSLTATVALAALGPRYGGTLRLGVTALPATLEPTLSETLGARGVSTLLHETLVGVGPEGLPTPGLVTSWTSSAGGREWTLSLHAAARFHDDSALTANDAVRSLRRFLRSPSRAAEWLALGLEGGMAFRDRRSSALPGAASLDGRRLVLRFPEPQSLPLAALASPLAAVTSATGQGCGPFVPTLHRPGRQLTLTAFNGHVRGRPYLDALDVHVLADGAALRAEWAGARIDAVLDAAWDARAFTQQGGVAVSESGAAPARGGLLLLVLDPTHAPFDRAETRAAAAAFRRDALVRPFIPGGEAWRALLPGSLLSSPAAPQGAPVPAPPGASFTLAVAKDVATSVSQRVVALLNDGGFEVRIEARRAPGMRRAPVDARLLTFVPEVAEPGLALHELAALGGASPEADQALAAARLELGLDRRRAWLLAAEQALRRDDTRLALAALPLGVVGAPKLHDLRLDGAGRLLAEDAWRAP